MQIGDVLASASQQRQRQSVLCANYPTARIRAWRWAGNPICQLGQHGVGHSQQNPRACLHRVVVLLGGVRASTCPVGPKLLPWGNTGDRGVSKTKLLTLVSQWDSATKAWHGKSLRSMRASRWRPLLVLAKHCLQFPHLMDLLRGQPFAALSTMLQY